MQKLFDLLKRYRLWGIWLVLAIWFGFNSHLIISDSDLEILYLAWQPEFAARWMPHYFHIYLLKLFVTISGSALAGARWYIGVALATILMGAFVVMRWQVVSEIQTAVGIAALLLFSEFIGLWLSPQLFSEITLTLLFLGAVALWVWFINKANSFQKHYALILMGILAVFAFHTALAGGVVLFLLLARMIMLYGEEIGWTGIWFALCGVFGGIIIMLIFDGLFLKDVFAYYRIENWAKWYELTYGDMSQAKSFWYQYVIYGGFWQQCVAWWKFVVQRNLLLWILLLASAFLHWKAIVDSGRIMFLILGVTYVVLQLILIEEISLVGNLPFWVLMMPILSDLFAGLSIENWRKEVKGFFLNPVVWGFLLVCAVYVNYLFVLRRYSDHSALNLMVILGNILILVLLFFVQDRNFYWMMALGLAVLFLQFGNVKEFSRWQVMASERRFTPLEWVGDSFVCDKNTNILISEKVWGKTGYLSKDAERSLWMFEMYFDCDLKNEQVVILEGIDSDILWESPPAHVWITKDEYLAFVQGNIEDKEGYEVFINQQLVYFSRENSK